MSGGARNRFDMGGVKAMQERAEKRRARKERNAQRGKKRGAQS